MKCKSCGMLIEKEWKYCPNCSKRTNKNKKIFIILSIVFIIILGFSVYTIVEKNAPVNETYIKKSLSKKYNENFKNIYHVESIDNPDMNLNCDGSSFGTIKGKGTKEYYKVYSEKNNIEFFAYYNTSSENKKIYDTYETYLNRRDNILEIYDFTKRNFSGMKFSISYNNQEPVEITTESNLKNILSNFDNKDISNFNSSSATFFEKIYIKLDEDVFNFSKDNYIIIKRLNDKVTSLRNKYYFSMTLLFNNDAKIELDGEPYVYNNFGNNKARGEKLYKFILRKEY